MSTFVAVLKPDPKCKNCLGRGKIKQLIVKGGNEYRKVSICACAFIEYENDDFEQVLTHMAKLVGRKVSRKSGIVTPDEDRLGI